MRYRYRTCPVSAASRKTRGAIPTTTVSTVTGTTRCGRTERTASRAPTTTSCGPAIDDARASRRGRPPHGACGAPDAASPRGRDPHDGDRRDRHVLRVRPPRVGPRQPRLACDVRRAHGPPWRAHDPRGAEPGDRRDVPELPSPPRLPA